MSTRAAIGIGTPTRWRAVYSHFDGNPDNMGERVWDYIEGRGGVARLQRLLDSKLGKRGFSEFPDDPYEPGDESGIQTPRNTDADWAYIVDPETRTLNVLEAQEKGWKVRGSYPLGKGYPDFGAIEEEDREREEKEEEAEEAKNPIAYDFVEDQFRLKASNEVCQSCRDVSALTTRSHEDRIRKAIRGAFHEAGLPLAGISIRKRHGRYEPNGFVITYSGAASKRMGDYDRVMRTIAQRIRHASPPTSSGSGPAGRGSYYQSYRLERSDGR